MSLTLKLLIKIIQHGSCPPLWTDGINAGPEGSGEQLRETFWLCSMIHLCGAVKSEPARRGGDLGSNPDPDDNFSLKLKNEWKLR